MTLPLCLNFHRCWKIALPSSSNTSRAMLRKGSILYYYSPACCSSSCYSLRKLTLYLWLFCLLSNIIFQLWASLHIFWKIFIGFVFFVQYATFSLGFWWGSRLVEENYANPVSATGFYDAGDVLVVFFSVLMAGFNLSQLSPAFEKIVQGRQAAARIFATIDREPLIKSPENGLKPERIDGVIRF